MSETLYGPGISKYKDIALRQNKLAIKNKKCLACKIDIYSGKYCVDCRKIMNAVFKQRNKERREQRRKQKERNF